MEQPVPPSLVAERLVAERVIEQREGISAQRRGSKAEESDRPEANLPHPQDVNEIASGPRWVTASEE